ncbi:MAG: hypothetical protein PHE86_06570, partial [Candidatus Marinimicrobia bacterium]|nr:hypothetical protein [Candidatus Neomarinimicrobiota bacterium]
QTPVAGHGQNTRVRLFHFPNRQPRLPSHNQQNPSPGRPQSHGRVCAALLLSVKLHPVLLTILLPLESGIFHHQVILKNFAY